MAPIASRVKLSSISRSKQACSQGLEGAAMIHFQYKRIGASFLEQLLDLLMRGESIVLLGPRSVGKRYVLRRLRERLLAAGCPRIGIVRFLAGPEAEDEALRDNDSDCHRL